MQAISRIQTYVFRYPLEMPVVTSFGRMRDRPAVLVRVEDSDGAYGWGEIWCNFPGCGAEHRARLVETVISEHLVRMRAEPAAMFQSLARKLNVLTLQTGEYGPLAQAVAGVDIALWDLTARKTGTPLRKILSSAASDAVPVYASGIHPDGLDATVEAARLKGYRAFKLKVGFGAEKDQSAAGELRGMLSDGERMMLDANQAWDLSSASDMMRRLAEYAPDWIEEPLAADRPWAEWRILKSAAPIPLAAGENLRGNESFDAAIAGRSLAVIQPDLCKWGGISGCLPVARRAVDAGLTYCPHFLGAGIGLVASAQLLAAAGGSGMLEVDSNPNPLQQLLGQPLPGVSGGLMMLPDSTGLGVEPNLRAAEKWLTFSTSSS